MDKNEAIQTIKQRMLKVEPLPDEPDFACNEDTIVRFLKAYEWKLQDAEKALLETVEWRRQNLPLRTHCRWCHGKPGYHSMRQVGHDESGRPVVYANFAQATAQKNSLEDIITHVTYLIENAKATMKPGVSTWVFLIDCTGMTMSVCSPKVGLKTVNLLSAHYPERLGLIICVNHNPIFHAFWKAIKKFLAPNTVAKMKLIRSESKIRQAFSTYFPADLATWMWDELAANKVKPLPTPQKQFWAAPTTTTSTTTTTTSSSSPSSDSEAVQPHDPRGCPSYVENCLDKFSPTRDIRYVVGERKMHCPHPNIAAAPGSDVEASIVSEINNDDGNLSQAQKQQQQQQQQQNGVEADGVTSSLTSSDGSGSGGGGGVGNDGSGGALIESDGSDETMPEITALDIRDDDLSDDDDDDVSSDEENEPAHQRHTEK